MFISIIIVEYKNHDMTRECIKSIFDTGFKDLEVIVIDNSENNIGLAAAQNKGAKRAQGDWLFFLNNDTKVDKDIFTYLSETGKWYHAVGCKMFSYDWSKELDSGISLDKFGCPAGTTGHVFYPDGAIFIRKEVFEELGGFDELLFLYGEDRDFFWRFHLGGFAFIMDNRARFAHASDSVVGTNYFRRRLSERNIIRSMIKNYTLKSLLFILPQYAFWSVLELGFILLTKPMAIFKCYIPAYWWNLTHLIDTLKKRKSIDRYIEDKDLPFSKEIGKLYVLKTQGMPKWKKLRY